MYVVGTQQSATNGLSVPVQSFSQSIKTGSTNKGCRDADGLKIAQLMQESMNNRPQISSSTVTYKGCSFDDQNPIGTILPNGQIVLNGYAVAAGLTTEMIRSSLAAGSGRRLLGSLADGETSVDDGTSALFAAGRHLMQSQAGTPLYLVIYEMLSVMIVSAQRLVTQ